MSEDDTLFILKAHELVQELDDLIHDSGIEHRVLSFVMVGLMDEEDGYDDYDGDYDGDYEDEDDEEEEKVSLRTTVSFNLDSQEELEAVKTIMDDSYRNRLFGGLLRGTGVSLN